MNYYRSYRSCSVFALKGSRSSSADRIQPGNLNYYRSYRSCDVFALKGSRSSSADRCSVESCKEKIKRSAGSVFYFISGHMEARVYEVRVRTITVVRSGRGAHREVYRKRGRAC